jgi:hypothetical protein
MPAIIAIAGILTFYIPSYQHVYSQSQPAAFVLGPADPGVTQLLALEDYSVTEDSVLPSDLSEYGIVILASSAELSIDDTATLKDYVEGGGGMVYLGDAAGSLDLVANHAWIGALTWGALAAGENVTVSVDNPVGSTLIAGDLVKLQSPEMTGAQWAGGLEAGAQILARYTGGSVFAYSYESGDGLVYFQADIDAGLADGENIEELLISGILWATSEPDDPIADLLPPGTEITSANEEPAGSNVLEFSGSGFESIGVTIPGDAAKSIFVMSDAGLENPTLFFEVGGQEYYYHTRDQGTLLTFTSALEITNARFEVDGGTAGTATVGYVTVRPVPQCNLPAGAQVTEPGIIPPDARQVGTTGIPVGSSFAIPDVPVPVSSLLVGFDGETNGFLVTFDSGGAAYECPVQPEIIEITFDEPTLISDAALENDGLWGLVGYLESPAPANAYARMVPVKQNILPSGFTIQLGSPAPSAQMNTASLSASDSLEILQLPEPTQRVSALWLAAGTGLVEPYLYLRSGQNWYSMAIQESDTAGSLLAFASSLDVDEIYVSADGGSQQGTISVAYVYPPRLDARAGSDQTVEEKQLVYLDAKSSTGPGSLTFRWTQIEGPKVTLQDANTDTASFSAPEVDEEGARLVFRLVVADSEGNDSVDSVEINVRNVKEPLNQPPQIGSINGATVDEGSRVVLSASAFDPDGDPVKYSWTQVIGPAADLTGANTQTVSFNAPEVTQDSVLVFQLRVADGKGHQVTKDVSVTVRNIRDAPAPILPALTAGPDQSAAEGSVVTLSGKLLSGELGAYQPRWDQTAGMAVSLQAGASPLSVSFVAPDVTESSVLTFRLGLFDAGGNMLAEDQVSINVTNSQQGGVQIEDPQGDSTSIIINEPGFSAVRRADAEPPSEIHVLTVNGATGTSAPTPAGPIVGIWVNATTGSPDLWLHFSTGRNYDMTATSDRAVAFVFDRQVALSNISLTTAAGEEAVVELGYYYDAVPLIAGSEVSTSPTQESAPVQAVPPEEGALVKFARENSVIAGAMAIGVPAAIGVALKMASTHRRKKRTLNPARMLFPKHDPIAGEAEKVRPVIEELEKMLGRNLDTAVSASELLDRFGSGKSETARS